MVRARSAAFTRHGHGRRPRTGAIDELRLHIATAVLGAGEPLLTGRDDLNLEQVSAVQRELVAHVTYRVVR
ncbi:hypothetical protein E3T35_09915 [Cryobacterium sp. TMT1-2-2]|uniref:hypothetical protein n=1 Tax=Cryobacterium sp. TMT1-2-2 TaxID=1259233 RepID=UPI00106D406E|nr:hypothetical protein [Cryobacterium sp. TMT1-2-2]TFD10908.1 hypothetical protein E3T35_09915 [Cryobacterium sp. TMT1-2-2]